MAGKLLLDTSVVVDLFAGDTTAKRLLARVEVILVPSIALGELVYGAEKSARPEVNLARVEDFAANVNVLACDLETARRYGKIKNGLRIKGRPLPENDIWIAAVAQQHGLMLATRDRHFGEIDGLALIAW